MYWNPIQKNGAGSISALIAFQKKFISRFWSSLDTDAHLIPNQRTKATSLTMLAIVIFLLALGLWKQFESGRNHRVLDEESESMKLLLSWGPMSEKIFGIKGRNDEVQKWSEGGTN